jgi:hypothetical protein
MDTPPEYLAEETGTLVEDSRPEPLIAECTGDELKKRAGEGMEKALGICAWMGSSLC